METGSRFSADYTVQGKLGEGAFGVVYLVEHRVSGEKFARKKIDLMKLSAEQIKNTEKEVEVMKKINHEHIISLKAFDRTESYLCIYTDYCSGGDLQQLLENLTTLSVPEDLIVCWLSQMAKALKYLHGKRILHRDIKPSNIYLTEKGNIKLGDLGIARMLKASESLATTMAGTPIYMSPEIFSGQGCNEKTDIWSMACIVHELATKDTAFGKNVLGMQQLMFRVVIGQTPNLPKTFSMAFRDLHRQMLSKKPKDRPSAAEILSKEPVKSYLSNPISPLSRLKTIVNSFDYNGLLVSHRKITPVDDFQAVAGPSTSTQENQLSRESLLTIHDMSTLKTIVAKKEKSPKNKTAKSMPNFDQWNEKKECKSLSDLFAQVLSTLSVQDQTSGARSSLKTAKMEETLKEQVGSLKRLCLEAVGEDAFIKCCESLKTVSNLEDLEMRFKDILGSKFEVYFKYIICIRLFENMNSTQSS